MTLRSILDQARAIHDACDLDLLLFFNGIPALLTSEQLVIYLGYGHQRIAASMAVLIDAGLLARAQSRSKNTHLYLLANHSAQGRLLSDLLAHAPGCEGRDRVARLLTRARRADAVAPADATPTRFGMA